MPGRVALVKLSALGDIVHALPVAAALRAAWPGVRLAWVVERRHAAVLRDHPALDEVVTVDTRAWRRARRPRVLVAALAEIARVRRRLRGARFDVALDLQGLVKSGVVAWATGAPLRVGFAARWGREPLSALFTNRRLVPPLSARHVVDQYLALLAALGVTPAERPEFHLPRDGAAETMIDEFFHSSGLAPRDRVVVLNPGAARPEKRWPAPRFAELAARLSESPGVRVAVLWGPGEEGTAREIAEGAAGGAVLLPPTDLHRLIAVLRRASVLVAGDTGPLHLGAALGAPCVGLFGPTSATRNGPYGRGHRALESPDRTMAAIDAGSVAGAVGELLEERGSRRASEGPGVTVDRTRGRGRPGAAAPGAGRHR